jgi:hypothetical protein
MTSTAILSREVCRDTPRHPEVRQRLHDRFDPWLDRLEDRMQEAKPTLEELTQALLALRQEWTHEVAEGVVERAHRVTMELRTAPYPQGGQTLSARSPHDRAVETLVGVIRLRRPYFDCERCQLGNAPLDAALGLTPRRQPPEVQKAAVKLTQELPYETACELFEELTGLPLSTYTAHEVTPEVAAGLGVLEVAPTPEEIAARVAAVAAGRTWRPLRVLAMDGAHVPTRPEAATDHRPAHQQGRAKRAPWTGEWREAKGVRCYLIDGERIVPVLSWHPVQTAEELAAARRQVKTAGLIPEAQVRRCVIADGARWIWKQTHELCPSAVERLDYYHGRAPLDQVAAWPYGAHQERPYAWYEAALTRLCWGEVASVMWGLQRMPPTDAQTAAEIATRIGSLQDHQERLDYRVARKGGDPMGSGGIESAHTCICHVRLKRSGAWWYVENANQMLA